MVCRTFEELLEALLAGTLDPATAEALASHRDGCARCRELEELVRAEPHGDDDAPPADFVSGVLARTSGEACTRAAGMLPDHVDGRSDPAAAELLEGHLSGCAPCRGLEVALAALAVDLPRLAEIRPDERFVDDVLARTVPWRRRFARDLARRWQALLARPRLAWEGAYLGALLLAVLVGTPGSPLASLPAVALELARVNPVEKLEAPVATIEGEISTAIGTGWKVTRTRIAGAQRGMLTGATETFQDLRRDLGTLWQRLASEEASADTDRAAPEPEATEGEQS